MSSRFETWTGLLRGAACSASFLAGLVAAGAAPADEPDYGRTGPYVSVGASIGTATKLEDQIDIVPEVPIRVDSAVGAEAKVGYRILSWLAAEGQVEWLPGFDAKIANDVKVIDGRTLFATANAKAFARPETRFQPFLLVGVGYMRGEYQLFTGANVDGQGFAWRAGGGLDAYFNEHWAISIDISYVVPSGDLQDLDYIDIGLGAVYRF